MTTLSVPARWPSPSARAHRSVWLREALRQPDGVDAPALAGDVACDVCIVGGGFTGLWTALQILARAPGTDVRLVEADVCGAGASGANAGYVMNLWPKYLGLRAITADDEARWLAGESSRAVADVLAFIAERGADVGCERAPWLWSATSPAQHGAWTETLEALAGIEGSPLREIDAEESRRLTGSDAHFGGVLDVTCASLQPAGLVRELRRAAIEAGVTVHEGTPMTRLQSGPRTTVRTPAGTIRADRVVLALNAWAAELEDLSRRMVMVASDTVLTEPIGDWLAGLGWSSALSASDSRRRLNYYRTTPEGRLVFGKGGVAVGFGARSASTLWATGDVKRLRRHLARLFPSLSEVGFAGAWRAPVEYSVTSLPFCGWLRSVPGACYATGYSGDGVGPSRMVSRILASFALSQHDEWSTCALTKPPSGTLPPEPLRFLGSRIVVPALAATEAAEDRGARAPWPVRRLASIDPTSFVG